ncbi:MAG: class I SAM-dependent methyltransferase [Candidatus Omnitrophota bacterium]
MDPEIRTETLTSCPICNSVVILMLLEARDYESNLGTYSIFRCSNCKVCFTNPRVIEEDIPRMYTENFGGVDIATSSNVSYILKTLKIRGYSRKILKECHKKENLRVLDLGCGDGLIASHLSFNKLCASVVAADFSPEAPAIFKKHPIKNLCYIQYQKLFNDCTEKFDLIVLRHVLEHTISPREFIRSAASLLADNGTIVIEIPNIDTVWRNIFKGKYIQLDVPFHFFHFNKQSFYSTFGGDYNIKRFQYASIPVLGPSLLNCFGLRVNRVGLMAIMFYPIQLVFNFIFQGYPAMLISLQNKSPD